MASADGIMGILKEAGLVAGAPARYAGTAPTWPAAVLQPLSVPFLGAELAGLGRPFFANLEYEWKVIGL